MPKSHRKAKTLSAGFTLVETLIVLTITGLLFVIAVVAVSGKQNETEFQQAINDVQNSLQQVIAQVNSGNYSAMSNFSCADTGIGKPVISPGAGVQEGSSTGCILLGKVVQFAPSGNSSIYRVYPIAGLSANGASLKTAAPTAVARSTSDSITFPDATTVGNLEYGLNVASMDYINGGASCSTKTMVGAVGFISELGTLNSSGQYLSGSQQVDLLPVAGSNLNVDEQTMADEINNSSPGLGLANSVVNPCGGVEICFASGTTTQSGLITIGGTGIGNLDSVTTSIKNGLTC